MDMIWMIEEWLIIGEGDNHPEAPRPDLRDSFEYRRTFAFCKYTSSLWVWETYLKWGPTGDWSSTWNKLKGAQVLVYWEEHLRSQLISVHIQLRLLSLFASNFWCWHGGEESRTRCTDANYDTTRHALLGAYHRKPHTKTKSILLQSNPDPTNVYRYRVLYVYAIS